MVITPPANTKPTVQERHSKDKQEPAMTETATATPKRNREIVLQCIVDICGHNGYASRAKIVELTGLKMTSVDEQIDRLKTDGLIRPLYNGVFEPIDQTIDRPVSTTAIPFGRTKIEVGDEIMELTPREAFALAKQLAGLLLAFRAPA